MEIYAAIDGYSRYIIWGYVGISARTSISVYRQYLDAAQSNCFIPRGSRVDLGLETYQIGGRPCPSSELQKPFYTAS
jgi:hypothetical protein